MRTAAASFRALVCCLLGAYIVLSTALQKVAMDDNPANKSNFDELSGHCKVLSAKLAQLTAGNSAASTAVEDLEDYYERALQLRVMANQTLREQLKETREEHAAFLGRIAHLVMCATALGALVLTYLYPQTAVHLAAATWSYVLVAVATATAVRTYKSSMGPKRE